MFYRDFPVNREVLNREILVNRDFPVSREFPVDRDISVNRDIPVFTGISRFMPGYPGLYRDIPVKLEKNVGYL